MDIILLEHISRLGAIGDVVNVRNGYARNYLIPQKKALRANKENLAVLEAQRDTLMKQDAERKEAAQKQSEKMQDLVVKVVRQASDDGKLYGSVSVRDIADSMEEMGFEVDRRLIDLNSAIKSLGVYDVHINLHPEVPINVKVHVARNADSPLPKEFYEDEEETQPSQASESVNVEAADSDADETSVAEEQTASAEQAAEEQSASA